jgi:hypothetical protein
MKLKSFIFLVLSLITALCGFFSAPINLQAAAEPLNLTGVILWIYPEYDDPRLLVMLEGRVSGVNPPAQIRFLVPSSAEMYSAGSKDAQGNYSGGPPNRTTSQIAGWDEISYQLQSSIFRVEYYLPLITGQVDKHISYDFKTIYSITDLETVIQVPTKASNFSVTPLGTPTTEGSFQVYSSKYTNLVPEQNLHFDISYTKSDPNPSLATPAQTPVSEVSSNIVLIFIIVGSVIVAGGLIWVLKATRKKTKIVKKAPSNIHTSKPKSSRPPAKFCDQCGKKLEYPSRFCPHCRSKLED